MLLYADVSCEFTGLISLTARGGAWFPMCRIAVPSTEITLPSCPGAFSVLSCLIAPDKTSSSLEQDGGVDAALFRRRDLLQLSHAA